MIYISTTKRHGWGNFRYKLNETIFYFLFFLKKFHLGINGKMPKCYKFIQYITTLISTSTSMSSIKNPHVGYFSSITHLIGTLHFSKQYQKRTFKLLNKCFHFFVCNSISTFLLHHQKYMKGYTPPHCHLYIRPKSSQLGV